MITDQPDMVEEVEILGSLGDGDRQMLRWTTQLSLQQSEFQGKVKDYNKANFEGIRNKLKLVDWDRIMSEEIEQSWTNFKNILEETVNIYFPDRKSISNIYKKKPWMTTKAVKSVRRKHNLFRRYKDINNPKYVDVAREARAETKRAKNFEKKLAENIKKDTKSFYAYVRNNNNIIPSIGPIVDEAGELKTDPSNVAEKLSNYFSSVFTKEDTTNLPQTTNHSDGRRPEIVDNIIITEETVKSKLSKLRADKATGVDDIFPGLLVEISDQISNPLTKFFQQMLQTGEVPTDFKLANVTSIYKKGTRSQPCNYRLISLTSQICRLLEYIIRD